MRRSPMKSVILLVVLAASAGLAAAAGPCGNDDPCPAGSGYCAPSLANASITECRTSCTEVQGDTAKCHVDATCTPESGANDAGVCECLIGSVDISVGKNGTDCSGNSHAVRFVVKEDPGTTLDFSTLAEVKTAGWCEADARGYFYRTVEWASDVSDGDGADASTTVWLEMRCLYAESTDVNSSLLSNYNTLLTNKDLYAGPAYQTFTLPTTKAPLSIPATGLTISNVFFNTTCAKSGCWTITGIMATGGSIDTAEIRNNVFNTFFLPMANGSDTLSYDFNYGAGGNSAGSGVDWTFQPVNHPCTSADFDASSGNTQKVTTCCITNSYVGQYDSTTTNSVQNVGGFVNNYRTTAAFQNWVDNAKDSADESVGLAVCSGVESAQIIQRIGFELNATHDADYDIAFPADPLGFLEGSWATGTGQFVGMPDSPGVTLFEVVDPFQRTFDFRIELDEVELRRVAGQLTGTVGVEHTVDTFLGLANFRTTGLAALDTFATQAAIHLEKTSFFTVSTHGVNEYTFLEYVNMRLVAIYNEDDDFSSTDGSVDETTEKFIRTDSTLAGHYVQVTFTLGAKYGVNDLDGSELIPSDSVRAGQGTFMDPSIMDHKCVDWEASKVSCDNSECGTATSTSSGNGAQLQNATNGTDSESNNFDYFEYLLVQSCAPQSSMCASPSEIPDQFVSYNVPLGIDYLPQPSNDLSANIFVSLVINAIDTVARDATGSTAPNNGGAPWQVKTTLTASIPVVAGGVNIFCDGLTGKTDLSDVTQVDLVVGSAASGTELTRLRILEDIQSTSLSGQRDPTTVDSDSIESGLMTLVIQGNESYFKTNPGRADASVELEDVVTIHIMEDAGGDFEDVSTCIASSTSMMCKVWTLITKAADDNTDSSGLDTSGYDLNGAFRFDIDRGNQQAKLEPKQALLSICPFNPPRPQGGSPLSSCITRRDVTHRGFPFRNGALSTAIEICPCATGASCLDTAVCHTSATGDEAKFFVSILGDSVYAKELSVSYAQVISDKYKLNGRYRRAFWINPGYEWTPTQTGGRSIFSISQKLFLFAIVTMDEGLTSKRLAQADGVYARRRMLLQSTPEEALQEGQSGVGTQMIGYKTSPKSMMARAFDVPEDRVATFDVKLQLTQAEACLSEDLLLSALQGTLEDYVTAASTPLYTVQITRMEADKAGVVCTRRAVRGLKSSFSAATADVTVMAVFKKGENSKISFAKLETMAGITSVTALSVSDKVDTTVLADEPDLGQEDKPSADSDSSSSTNTALIGGVAGGVAGALVIGAGVLFYMRNKRTERETVIAVQTINVADLKTQLAADV